MADETDQASNRRLAAAPLQPVAGGGTFDRMVEARIASLEADVRNIRENVGDMKGILKAAGRDLADLKVGYAILNERISHLPTKSYIGWCISGGLTAAVAALTVLSRFGLPVATGSK